MMMRVSIVAFMVAMAASTAVAQLPFVRRAFPQADAVSAGEGTLLAEEIFVDPSQFQRQRLELVLFGEPVTAIRERLFEMPGGAGWVGALENEAGSNVVLSNVEGAVVGTILRRKGQMLRIFPSGKAGKHILELFDNIHARPEADPAVFTSSKASLGASSSTCTTDAATTIDVLVVFTKDAQVYMGGESGMKSGINCAIIEANESYRRSDVHFELRLVHAQLIDYAETGRLEEARVAVESINDNVVDDVHALRDQYGADLVVLIVERFDASGKATVMDKVDLSFAKSAFAVVARYYLTGSYTFAHEIGHLMGARHEWFDDPADNQPDHANHGYVRLHPKPPNQKPWRTIMSTQRLCDCAGIGCARVFYWSNPALFYPSNEPLFPDDALGIGEPEPTDDHATLNASAVTVANFRCQQ